MPAAAEDREREHHKRYQDMLIFWQQAIIAYSFQYGKVPSSASILAFTYDLKLPDGEAEYGDLNVSGHELQQHEFELDINGLPESALTSLTAEYAPHMRLGNFGNLLILVSSPEGWSFTTRLLSRNADYGDRLQTDLDFSDHNISQAGRIQADIYADQLTMSGTVTITQLSALSAVSERLLADEAVVAEQDFASALRQFEQLEQQMNACLAVGGGCTN